MTPPFASRYRKRPVVIYAFQFGGEFPLDWLGPEDSVRSAGDGTGAVVIQTLEGDMYAHPGDWIVRGVKGELYPVRDDIFALTYEEATG